MEAIIRMSTTHDFAAVGKVMTDCYSKLAVQEGYTRLELEGLVHSCTPSAVMKRWASFCAFVAEVEGTVVGVIAIEGQEITELFVSPDWQGQGIGRSLLAEVEREVAASGADSVFVWTATAPAFYQGQAYHVVEIAPCSGGPLQGRPTTRLTKRLPAAKITESGLIHETAANACSSAYQGVSLPETLSVKILSNPSQHHSMANSSAA